MASASIWQDREAWMRSRCGGGDDDADGGGISPWPTGGDSTTSGTTYTYTASSSTTTSGSVGELRPRDTAPRVGEDRVMKKLAVAKELEEDSRMKKLEHLKGLVMEFRGDSRRALKKWLLELDVGWVLHLAGTHESSGSVVRSLRFRFLVERWILALRKIGESIFTSLDGWCSQSQRQDQDEGMSKQPSASEFAQLVQAAVLQMLPFVDVAAVKTTNSPGAVATSEKLQALIDMRDALSMASQHILSLLVESTDGAMGDLLSAEMTKLDEVIWGTIVKIMNNIIACTWRQDDGASNIHNVTHCIVRYTQVMCANYGSVNRILHDAFLHGEYVPENGNLSHVSNLIMAMVSSLQRMPSTTKSSQAASPDQSLRLLFLINNYYYLLQESEFRTISRLDFPLMSLTHKIDDYIDSYLHVSWEPVLKCLEDPATPRCFTRYSSPLSKFESKFQKTYAAQKQWKVPDPDMRKRLWKAVIDKVVPVFTQFLEDHSIVTAIFFNPGNLENMLGELFEG